MHHLFRHSSRLLRASVAALAIAVLMIGPAWAQQAEIYTDPEGRFTTTIPAGWNDNSTEGYGRFEAENGTVIYVLAVEAADLETGAQASFELVAPDLVDAEPLQSTTAPAPNGIWTQYIYMSDGIGALLIQVDAGIAFSLYVHAPSVEALQAVNDDLTNVLLSFSLSTAIDLTGVEPAAPPRSGWPNLTLIFPRSWNARMS